MIIIIKECVKIYKKNKKTFNKKISQKNYQLMNFYTNQKLIISLTLYYINLLQIVKMCNYNLL